MTANTMTMMGSHCWFSSTWTPPIQKHRSACLPPGSRQTVAFTLLSSMTGKPLSSSSHALNGRGDRRRGGRGGGASVKMMNMEAGIGVMGTKLGMMTYFEPEGTVVPVTVVGFREGNIVTQVKTAATDGYDAVQVGYRRVRDRKLTKPELGHLTKAGVIPMRHLQEFRLQSADNFEPGQRLVIDEIFKEGDLVDVSGKTIGKGFQVNQSPLIFPLLFSYSSCPSDRSFANT